MKSTSHKIARSDTKEISFRDDSGEFVDRAPTATRARHYRRTKERFFMTSFLALVLLFIGISASAQTAAAPAAKSQFAKLDRARIHYKSYGKGPEALVLIHGWTCNMDHWRDQVPAFAKRTRVITLDLIGHGLSDKPQVTYSLDLFARAVDAVMRDANVKRAVLVGHSMGTPVAREFYRMYPEKTLGIVIVDGGLRLFGDQQMRDQFLAMFRAPTYREAGAKMFASMIGPGMTPEGKERVSSSFGSTPQYVLVSAMEQMGDASKYGPDKISVPVLAIMAKSPFWAPDTEQFMHSLAPDLDFHWWDGVGHFLMMEKPKEFNEAVLAFLEKKSLLK